jgi:hypothetical protein
MPDERTIEELEAALANMQGQIEQLSAKRDRFSYGATGYFDAVQRIKEVQAEMEATRAKLAAARAAHDADLRHSHEHAAARTVQANERMALASEAAARASAEAARWTLWVAIFTALAAGGSLVTAILQLIHGK